MMCSCNQESVLAIQGHILPDYDILVDCTFGNGLEQRIFAALFFFTMYICIQYYVIATNGRALI